MNGISNTDNTHYQSHHWQSRGGSNPQEKQCKKNLWYWVTITLTQVCAFEQTSENHIFTASLSLIINYVFLKSSMSMGPNNSETFSGRGRENITDSLSCLLSKWIELRIVPWKKFVTFDGVISSLQLNYADIILLFSRLGTTLVLPRTICITSKDASTSTASASIVTA